MVRNRHGLLAAAALGGLYWASRQPGGIPGTWSRLKGALGDIQHGGNPMETLRGFVKPNHSPAMPSKTDTYVDSEMDALPA
jgi:hypothetical protein